MNEQDQGPSRCPGHTSHYRSPSRAVARKSPLRLSSQLLTVTWVFLQSHMAFASGSLPPMPLAAGPFKTFAACLDYLESTYRQHTAMAMPEPLKSPQGDTHQTILTTKGVVRGVGQQATYEAEIGHVNRRIDTQFHQIVTSYDWLRYSLTCHGAVFSGSQQNGYALQGLEPMPQTNPSEGSP
jgi:hypothetical protein